ncbi:MAG: TetR/AcrR family transcriptional regulator [Bacteroidetes bacterium]|nr:TetR/AcrR family transcriptional regulator [Bacteroidota bacterium]MBI3481399.1 TetR/AcrR family transcriptional regulator [Bacteroidota bacterium]
MSTREEIIHLGDQLIRDKGFNAFSFYDISKKLKIKNASVHYHFPTKSDLGLSILDDHTKKLHELIEGTATKSPMVKLNAFLSIYTKIKSEGRVCLVGSLATDLNTVDPKMAKALKVFANEILEWVTSILQEGRTKKVFAFQESARTKALMIISNMLAALQLSRLTDEKDFYVIQQTVIKDLKS